MGWVERESYAGRKAEFGHIKSKTDAHGWRICALIKVDYDGPALPWVEAWREDTTGRVFDRQTHPLPLQPDSLEMMIAGPNVHLIVGVHTETVLNRRTAKRLELVIPNWYEPWPEQGLSGEREGAATYIPIAEEGVEELSDEDIERIAHAVMQQMVIQFGGSSIRDGIEQKVMDGIGKAFDPNLYHTNTRAKYVQDACAPFLRDRAFEGAEAAEDNDAPPRADTIEDGHGSVWVNECLQCGGEMQVVRPGKVQCTECS